MVPYQRTQRRVKIRKVKKTTLFGGGFSERATKRIGEQAKVGSKWPPLFWRRAPLQTMEQQAPTAIYHPKISEERKIFNQFINVFPISLVFHSFQ